MMLKIRNYKHGYHIASFAKSDKAFEDMKARGYSAVCLTDAELFFYPESWSVKLDVEEAAAFSGIEEYSILEFSDRGAYLYLDAGSADHTLFITNKCNSNCIMCPVSDPVRKNSEIETADTLLKIAGQIPCDTGHITITGGEPFMMKTDIFRLFDYLRRNLNQTEYLLLTNGRILADREYFTQFEASVPDKMLVGVPLHGYDAETHDRITRARGSFEQTMKGLKNLLSAHIKVEIRIVVSRLNLDFMDQIADFIARELKGVYTVKFMGLEMLGNARHNFSQVWVDYKESFPYMKEAVKKLVLQGFDVGIYNYPLCCVEKGYWPICEKSITDYKIRYLPQCDNCTKKDACGGMFAGTFRLMEGIVEAIK